jgi:hypothetical protein
MTLIKPMNEEEEEAPFKNSCVHQNHLARERHAVQSEEQCATNAADEQLEKCTERCADCDEEALL